MNTIQLPADQQIVDVPGYVRGNRVWIFCPHEARWHSHSRGERAVGYVAAHCLCPVSRFSTTFRITKRGELTDEIRRAHRERRRCATCSASAATAA